MSILSRIYKDTKENLFIFLKLIKKKTPIYSRAQHIFIYAAQIHSTKSILNRFVGICSVITLLIIIIPFFIMLKDIFFYFSYVIQNFSSFQFIYELFIPKDLISFFYIIIAKLNSWYFKIYMYYLDNIKFIAYVPKMVYDAFEVQGGLQKHNYTKSVENVFENLFFIKSNIAISQLEMKLFSNYNTNTLKGVFCAQKAFVANPQSSVFFTNQLSHIYTSKTEKFIENITFWSVVEVKVPFFETLLNISNVSFTKYLDSNLIFVSYTFESFCLYLFSNIYFITFFIIFLHLLFKENYILYNTTLKVERE